MTNEDFCVYVFQVIDQERQIEGLNKKELAARMGVSYQQIINMYYENENITISTLNRIAKAMNKRVRIVFENDEKPPLIKNRKRRIKSEN